MKRFLVQLGIFYCLSICIFMTFEVIARQSPNEYKAKRDYMSKHAGSIEVLIFGSSHNYFGLRPALFSLPTYSLANVSQGVYYDYRILDMYIDYCKNLKYIICDMSTFSPQPNGLENGAEWYRVASYELYMGFNDHSIFSKYNYELSEPRVFKSKFKKGIKEFIHHTDLEKKYPGGVDNEYSIRNRIEGWDDASEALKRHIQPFDNQKYRNAVSYYTKIASICKSKGIKMILLTTPTMKCYYEKVPRERIALMKSVVDKTAMIWEKTYYINLLADERFDDDDFFDTDHLNCENGAVKLTQIVNNSIQSLD